MFGIGGNGGFFNSVLNVAAQAALGVATGGTSLLVTTALKGVMLAVGDQVLQQLGDKLGLPQSVTDMAQATFHAAAGDIGGARQNISEAAAGLAQAAGGDAFDAGQFERLAQDGAKSIVDNANEYLRRSGEDEERSASGAGGKGKDSLLVALAKAMGKVIDQKMGQMQANTEQMGSAKGEKYGQLTAETQALGQEISMISQSLNSAIKSIGEAGSTLARKG